MTSYTRRPLDPATVGLLRGEKSRFEGEWQCPIPECDRPIHQGMHEDADGFRWRQDPREAAEDRVDEQAKGKA